MKENHELSDVINPPSMPVQTDVPLGVKVATTVRPYPKLFKSGLEISKLEVVVDDDVVQNLIVKGALSALVGSSGIGKSSLARQIAYSIIKKDESVVGFKITASCNDVIYWSTEDSLSQWIKQLKIFNRQGDLEEALDRLHLLFGTEADTMKDIDQLLQYKSIALVIVDVYSDVFSGDPNNNIQVRQFLGRFKNLATKYQTSFLFIHHNGKRTEKFTPSKNNIMGSQGFESSMRSVFELRADQQDQELKHLCILKHNYLGEAEKQESYILKQNTDMTFHYTGVRRGLQFLSETSQKVAKKDAVTKEILRLHASGLSSRSIVKVLIEQGMDMGKTQVANIIKEFKAQNQIIGDDEEIDEIE